MARSVIADAPFTHTTLTYSAPGTTPGQPDEYGNPTWSHTTGTVKALIAPYRFDQLRYLEGADTELIRGRGELIDPVAFPTGVGVGSKLTLTYAGQSYELTVLNVIENDLPGVSFGAYFGFTMRLAGA